MAADDGEGTTQGPTSEDEAAFHRYGAALADAVDLALADWVERCVVGVLVEQGVDAPGAVRAFPDDPFDLSPATFGDIDERLAEPGLRWGAAKAYVHLARRRAAGG